MPPSKRYNNYTLNIIIAAFAGLGLFLAVLILHLLRLGIFSEWLSAFVDTTFGLFFVSRIVSGISYLSFLVDKAANEKTPFDVILQQIVQYKKKFTLDNAALLKDDSQLKDQKSFEGQPPKKRHKFRIVGTLFGSVVGLAVAITGVVLRVILPEYIDRAVSSIIYFLDNIGNFSGLFNRLGRSVDYFNTRKAHELFRKKHVNYVLGVIGGFVLGFVLGAVILAVAGVTTSMTFGAAAPIWVGAALFLVGTISTGASTGGYVGRCFDFLLGKRSIVGTIKDQIEKKPATVPISKRVNCENVGTLIGLGVGITLGIILIAAGVATLPFFGLGLPKLFAGAILLTACISQGAGLGNRIGQAFDKFFHLKKRDEKYETSLLKSEKKNNTESHQPDNNNAPSAVKDVRPADSENTSSKTAVEITAKEQTDEEVLNADLLPKLPLPPDGSAKPAPIEGQKANKFKALMSIPISNPASVPVNEVIKEQTSKCISDKKTSAKNLAKLGLFSKIPHSAVQTPISLEESRTTKCIIPQPQFSPAVAA